MNMKISEREKINLYKGEAERMINLENFTKSLTLVSDKFY